MCLCINSTGNIIPIKAKKAILCVKFGHVLDKNTFSPSIYSAFRYQKGVETEPVQLKPKKYDGIYEVEKGYHSYKISNDSFLPGGREHLFIIPKNAEYLEGGVNSALSMNGYVSSKLIWVGSFRNPITWIRALFIYLKD